jgi:ABC-type sugar transport system ATPase subunit
MTMATNITVMDKGVLQQSDTPDTIYINPANTFVAGFIGNPKMNLLPGCFETREGELYLYVGEQQITVPEDIKQLLFKNKLIGKTLTLGLRPEHITVSSPQTSGLMATFLYSENTGADVYMHFLVEGCDNHIIARTSAGIRYEVKDLSICINWKCMLLFNSDATSIKM